MNSYLLGDSSIIIIDMLSGGLPCKAFLLAHACTENENMQYKERKNWQKSLEKIVSGIFNGRVTWREAPFFMDGLILNVLDGVGGFSNN